MGSEFLTPDILWRLSIIVPVDAAVGSEFLTRDLFMETDHYSA